MSKDKFNQPFAECLLVSIDYNLDKDNTVLIVGKKTRKKDVEIINAFQGEEAKELYLRLIEKKEN